MDKNENKGKRPGIIAIIVVIIVAIVVAIIFGVKNYMGGNDTIGDKILYTEADGIKTNISEKLAEEKTMDGLKFTNMQLTYQEEMSVLRADVINETAEKSGDFDVNLKIVDQNGQEIITIMGYIPPVEAGETTLLDTAVTADIAGAYNFEISRAAE